MRTTKVELYSPFPVQRKVHNCEKRFRIVVCGRRFGKTTLAVNEAIKQAVQNPGSINWWVAPTHQISQKGWREYLTYLPYMLLKGQPHKTDRRITLLTDATMWFKSADNPDSLIGEGLNFAVCDEAARIKEEAYERALRPALSDKMGGAMFISTPHGRNWFYHLYLRGKDPLEKEYQSFRYPSWENPMIDRNEIDEAERTLPERIFKQEYGAEFIDDGGQVFSNIEKLVRNNDNMMSKRCVIGIDWGKYQDYTVMMVMDTKGNVIEMKRLGKIDYEFQIKQLKALERKYKPLVIQPEINSMGDPLVERLKRELSSKVRGFLTTNSSKREIIEDLAIAMEKEEISYPREQVLINELEAYEYEITTAGNIKYHAPEGDKWHDDCVMALALAWNAKVNLPGRSTAFMMRR